MNDQDAYWSADHYQAVASRLSGISLRLVQEADVRPDHHVLDVACATGNAAFHAARRSAEVTGIDYDPVMIEAANRRRDRLRMSVAFRRGDAARMPFPDGSFDRVLSAYGSMFAPEGEAAALEMLRVCRPTGMIVMANWNPDSVITSMFQTLHDLHPVAESIQGIARLWGTAPGLRHLFGPTARIRTLLTHYRVPGTADELASVFADHFGPALCVVDKLGEAAREEIRERLTLLFRKHETIGPEARGVDVGYLHTWISPR
ncbi:class I SAM-dependent methyltransferase [Streptomyces sp. NPDC090022]|uniref:class I SAM-dependent methyltransferase n=1 Tax=Streptomyces sp. NPDC090022 TaxID=3365920 RepID=UPI00380B3971